MGSYNTRKLTKLEKAVPNTEFVEISSEKKLVVKQITSMKFDKNGKWIK